MSTSQQTPCQNGEIKSESQRLIELLAPVREQVVRSIMARFPMRGLEQVIRETFDNAVFENLDHLSSFINPPTIPKKADETSAKARQKADQLKVALLEASESIKKPPPEEEENLKEDILCLRKEIDRLILELKIRDRKLREQERFLKMRAVTENSLITPLLEGANNSADPELASLWKRVSTFLEKDPKFKILRLLMMVKELKLEEIYKSIGVQKQLVARYLEEMKKADLIQIMGDTVSLKI